MLAISKKNEEYYGQTEFVKMHWLPAVTRVAGIPLRVRECPSFADALDAIYGIQI